MWEQLYKPTAVCGCERGTLYYTRQNFGMVNVKPSVKKNYEAAESLMLSVTKVNLSSAFMVRSDMKSLEDNPTKISVPAKDVPLEEWQSFFTVKLKAFVKEYVMIEFDSEKVVKSGTTQTAATKTSGTSDLALCLPKCTEKTSFEPGEITNYNT